MAYDPVGAMTGGNDGGTAPASTYVMTLPAGAAAGNLAYVSSVILSTTATATISSGGATAWTVTSGPDAGPSGGNTQSYFWSKVLEAGDIGNTITVTWTASTRGITVGQVYPSGGSIGTLGYATVAGGGTSLTAAGVTVPAGGTVGIVAFNKANTGVTLANISTPSGYTKDKDAATVAASATNYRGSIFHKGVTSTGTEGAVAFTFDASTNGALAYTIPFSGSNNPPTVTVGSNQDVAAGATVNLTSTASDVDGTIASRAWSFDYPTSGAPTLTGASSANASFTAGSAGSLYILRHTATDNSGATASATMEVRVPLGTAISPIPGTGTGVGTWNIVGGSATGGDALADSSDATYLETATVSVTEQRRRWRLNPSSVRTNGTITVRVAQDSAGSLTAKVRLFEGNTQRQEWTITVTTTIADQTVTLSGPTISAITDWGNLYVEVAVTS